MARTPQERRPSGAVGGTSNTCPECGGKWRDEIATPGVQHRTRLCIVCADIENYAKGLDDVDDPKE